MHSPLAHTPNSPNHGLFPLHTPVSTIDEDEEVRGTTLVQEDGAFNTVDAGSTPRYEYQTEEERAADLNIGTPFEKRDKLMDWLKDHKAVIMKHPDGTPMTRKEVIIKRRGAFIWLPVFCSNDLVHGSW